MKWKKPQLPMITILIIFKMQLYFVHSFSRNKSPEIKTNPKVYTTQEGMQETKITLRYTLTQEGIEDTVNTRI